MFRRKNVSGPTEVSLEDGGWFDLSASSEIYSWSTYPQGTLTRYRLLRTRNGSIILEHPEPSVVLAGIRTSDRKLYRTLAPVQACSFLVENGAEAAAKQLFPTEYTAIRAKHQAAER